MNILGFMNLWGMHLEVVVLVKEWNKFCYFYQTTSFLSYYLISVSQEIGLFSKFQTFFVFNSTIRWSKDITVVEIMSFIYSKS